MPKLPPGYTLTPLADNFELGPEFEVIQEAAKPDTVQRIAAIIEDNLMKSAGAKLQKEPDGTLFDHDSNWGVDPQEIAREICNMIFEGEPIADE